jgi:elongation factor Ts
LREVASIVCQHAPGARAAIIDAGARPGPNAEVLNMTQVAAQLVKELRERTGAGMMDCKGALQETGGDMEQAVDLLRKKGLAKAAKKAGRIAAEGLIGLVVRDRNGVLVEVNSETDFVARNELFQGLVKMIADVALTAGADVERIKAAKVGALTVGEAITDSVAKIGENMSLRRASSLSVVNGVIGSYMHNSVDEGLGKIGVLVALESDSGGDELLRFGRMVAMHVAASNPQALDAAGLAPDVVRREREVFAERFRAEGKPPNIIDRIVESALKTFYKEVCLLDQAYIHEPDKSVAQAVKDAEKRVGGPIRIAGFLRYALGEGIDRPDDDFGSEVAALVRPG